jgi:hypothetical protein
MDFLRPDDWAGALAAKAERPDALPIAGGTDLMVELNFDHRRPAALLDLNRVTELAEWDRVAGRIRIGAGVPYSRIITELGADLPAPGEMVEILGETISVDDQADAADTIGYEILTSLRGRYARNYVDNADVDSLPPPGEERRDATERAPSPPAATPAATPDYYDGEEYLEEPSPARAAAPDDPEVDFPSEFPPPRE